MRCLVSSILICIAVPVFSQVNLHQGLVACYAFSGNANDGTGHNHHGMVSGAQLTTDRFGIANSAYQFDGVSDYIEIPAAPFINSTYSYSLWARASSLPGNNNSANIFSIGDATSKHQTINVSDSYASAGYVGITVGGYNIGTPSTTSVQSGILPTINKWYHIVSIRVNNEMRMYVNGVLIGTTPTNMTGPYYGSSVNAVFGTRCNFTQFFNGAIDDIAIYNRTLTMDEIQELYQHGAPCSTPPVISLQQGLIACYAFSGDVTDGSGHGYNGTLNGPILTNDRYGITNSAYRFDGVDDYISIPSQPLITNKDYTFSMWINVITNPSYRGSATLISIGQSSGKHLGITLTNHYATADFLGWTSGGTNETGANPPIIGVESRALPNANQWYHLVTTRDKDFLTLYVNGVYVASAAANGSRPLYFDPATYTATLGIRAGLSQPLKAILDDVVIYDRAINTAEVYELYTIGLPCSTSTVRVDDQKQCGEASFIFTASGNAWCRWYDAETGGNLLTEGNIYTTPILTQTTSYYVTGTLNGITSAPVKVTATVLPKPEITCVLPNALSSDLSASYTVTVTSGTQPFSYMFDFGDETIVYTSESTVDHSYAKAGDYSIKIKIQDANGCTASCETLIKIIEENIFIPNVITPDMEDHLNDIFTLYIITQNTYAPYAGTKAFSMRIENRWGVEVFSTSNGIEGWRGQNVASGVYYYLINFGRKQYKGWVQVIK